MWQKKRGVIGTLVFFLLFAAAVVAGNLFYQTPYSTPGFYQMRELGSGMWQINLEEDGSYCLYQQRINDPQAQRQSGTWMQQHEEPVYGKDKQALELAFYGSDGEQVGRGLLMGETLYYTDLVREDAQYRMYKAADYSVWIE